MLAVYYLHLHGRHAMKTFLKGIGLALMIIAVLGGVAVLGIASKGFTSWDVASWGEAITEWGTKFKSGFDTTNALMIFFS